MKTLLLSIGVAFFFTQSGFAGGKMGLYSLNATDNQGKQVPLSAYAGKVTVVVNTASQCGYTPQYQDLQAVYEKYKDKGVVVLGFPSNDFGAQEPGSNEEIVKFCQKNYGVTFPLFSKDKVKGPEKQPVFKFLTENKKEYSGEVAWNFEKFIVDKKGNVVARFKSGVTPSSPEFTKALEAAL